MAGKKKTKKAAGEGGKAKKSPSKKKSKKSEDAKTRQQEQRAAVEEQRRRLREELINSFLRHKLQKEQLLTRQNQAKLTDKWRRLMRESKSAELSKELEIIKTDFEKRAESNSRQINQLLAELDQHARDFSDVADAHSKSTKETYGDHLARLSVLNGEFDEERARLETKVASDYGKASEVHAAEKTAMKDSIEKLQVHYRQSYEQKRSECLRRKDEIVNQGLEEQQSQRMALERRLEQMWRQLHENCVENGELDDQLWTLYANLKRKDLVAANEVAALEKRLEQLNRTSSTLTHKMKAEHVESAAEMQRLVQYRTTLHDRREQLREKLRTHQRRSTELLKAVCSSSSETVQYLETLVTKGMAIVRSAHRCVQLKPSRPLERDPSIDEDLVERQRQAGESPPAAARFEHQHFQHFWTRFNNAYLETLILQKQMTSLVRERQPANVEDRLSQLQLSGTSIMPSSGPENLRAARGPGQ